MNISHIALYTNDIERTREFYLKYFGGVSGVKYRNNLTGFSSYFIRFDGGTSLEIMNLPGLASHSPHEGEASCGWAHLAFRVESRERVCELCETLRRDGITVSSEPRVTGDGYFECVILDPDGNTVEITA